MPRGHLGPEFPGSIMAGQYISEVKVSQVVALCRGSPSRLTQGTAGDSMTHVSPQDPSRHPGGAPLHAHPSSRGAAVNSWPVSALAGLVCALLFLSLEQ